MDGFVKGLDGELKKVPDEELFEGGVCKKEKPLKGK